MKFLFVLLTIIYSVSAVQESSTFDCTNWRNKLDDEGNIIFIAGDRGYVPPETIPQIDPLYCSRQLISLERIRMLARNCMKPFPKQILGLMTYGSRKDVKSLCKAGIPVKQELLKNNVCFRDPKKLNALHDAMDTLILKFESIRDDVKNESLKIPHICCNYNQFLDQLKVDFYKICGDKQIDYWIEMTERKLDDAQDILCYGYRRGSANNKCPKFLAQNPLVVPEGKKKESTSIILALVDTLSQLASAPEEGDSDLHD